MTLARSYFRMKHHLAGRLPAMFRDQELRYPEELVATFVQRFTQPGEAVFDPFSGYGTTMRVAEQLGRAGYGLEADAQRVAFVRGLVRHPERLVHGDARHLLEYDLPPARLVMCAPPFMAFHEPVNPLRGAASPDAYQDYLADLGQIFAQVAQRLVPDGRVVIEVANLKDAHGVTMLAWDVARAVAQVLVFQGEIVVTWDRYHDGYDHSYCLLFSTTRERDDV